MDASSNENQSSEVLQEAVPVVHTESQKNGTSYGDVAKKIGTAIFKGIKSMVTLVLSAVKSFLVFFFALSMKQKIMFLVSFLVFGLTIFFVGYELGQDDIRSEVEDILDISYDKLD